MNPTFFQTASAFRQWLELNHATAAELWVGYFKISTGQPSLTWPESVDEALCFGWIDGLRKSIDASSYKIRFTPRRPRSIWSAVNIRRVEELTRLGLMHPAGMQAFAAKTENRSGIYSYEQRPTELPSSYAEFLQADCNAWAFFQAQPPYYRKMATWWILSAKTEATRLKRIQSLIEASANGKRL